MTVTFLNAGSTGLRRNRAAAVVAAVGVAAMAVTGPAPTASAQAPIADWLSRADAHIEGIHTAENGAFAVIQAPDAINTGKLLENCTQLHDANEGLRNGMPTPDPKLTVEVQQAIDNFDSAAQSCVDAAHFHSASRLDDFVSLLAAAELHLSRADTILVALAPAG